MLLNPCAVDDNFRFFVGSSELGRDVGNAATLLDFALYLFGYTPTSGV